MAERISGSTPEKQLLRLIEQPELADEQKESLKRKGVRSFSLGALKGRLSFLKEKIRSGFTLKKLPLGIKMVNRGLATVVVVAGGYFLLDLARAIADVKTGWELDSAETNREDENSEGEKLGVIHKPVIVRPIFDFNEELATFESVVKKKTVAVEHTDEQVMDELIEGLSFGGAWINAKDPKASTVYIKDRKTQRTVKLKIGGEIVGMKIVEIDRSSATLRYRDVLRKLSSGR